MKHEISQHELIHFQNNRSDESNSDNSDIIMRLFERVANDPFKEQLRTVFCTKAFFRAYKKLTEVLKRKMELIKNNIGYLNSETLDVFFRLSNSKILQGGSDRIFKFRLSQAARVLFYYLDTDEGKCICFENIVVQHDDQGAKRNKKKRAGAHEVPQLSDISGLSENKLIKILNRPLYNATTFLPILSDKQRLCCSASLPAIINGSAGSGKTNIAVDLYSRYCEFHPGARVAYISKNPALVDTVKELIRRTGIASPECVSYASLADLTHLNGKLINDSQKTDFYNGCNKNRIRQDILWLCINSFIKGEARLLDTGGMFISDEQLVPMLRKQRISEEIDYIKLAKQYQSYLSQNALYDENDLARELNKHIPIYDCIIVDEAQDFTNLQIQAIIHLCKSHDYVLLGDKNQTIVPSSFDFGAFRADLNRRQNIVDCQMFNLKDTYRCGSQVIDYINRLSSTRRDMIASQSLENDEMEKSMRPDTEDDLPPVIVTNAELIEILLAAGVDAANCAIITDSEASKKELIKKLVQDNDYDERFANIFTVEESKGLEFQICILYGFVDANRTHFEEIRSGLGKKSTVHRIVFNKFYVSCTRAEDRLIICESEENVNAFKSMLFNGVEINNDESLVLGYLNSTAEEWLKAAEDLYEKKRYDLTSRYLAKYVTLPDMELNEEYYRLKINCEAHIKANGSNNREVLIGCANVLSFDEPDDALDLYTRIRKLSSLNSDEEYNEMILKIRTHRTAGIASQEIANVLLRHKMNVTDIRYMIDNALVSTMISNLTHSFD